MFVLTQSSLNVHVTVGLGKESPSYYVWNPVLAKSTFHWLCATDAFLSLYNTSCIMRMETLRAIKRCLLLLFHMFTVQCSCQTV